MAAMFLYNGYKLPEIPEDVAAAYPYMVILRRETESSDERFSPGNYYLIASDGQLRFHTTYDAVDAGTGFYRYVYEYDVDSGTWVYVDRVGFTFSLGTYSILWTRYDLHYGTETTIYDSILLPASEPVPVEEVSAWTPDPVSMTLGWLTGRRIAGQRKKQEQQWETLWEGEATTTVHDDGEIWVVVEQLSTGNYLWFNEGERVRITVDGVPNVFTAIYDEGSGGIYGTHAGNPGLDSDRYEDTGYDYCVSSLTNFMSALLYFHSRLAGTYSVKIERAVK